MVSREFWFLGENASVSTAKWRSLFSLCVCIYIELKRGSENCMMDCEVQLAKRRVLVDWLMG